ncbi:hypothetical protein [Photobacterium profundum]|uniref:hypothetical protein n=1 Tax=Photobacterium profundum TaxID=74109 RepID=UPI0002F80240|nr:hypothetical protein [Photobacterium profundum]
MLKYIVLALIGFGIYIGVTYQDQISDLTNSRSFEDVQDVYDDVKDQAMDDFSSITDKVEA